MIKSILDNVLSGAEMTFHDAGKLLSAERDEAYLLIAAADSIRRRFCGNKIDLCSLINAKSGLCPEDCKYCGQSSKYNTGCKTYPLVSINEMIQSAQKAKEMGSHNFCIVISGPGPDEKEFNIIKDAIQRIKKEVGIEVDCSLGKITKKMAKDLKDIGVDRYNHNLETSGDFYKKICTTHSYKDRLDTVKNLKESGLEPCCGGIIGIGEDIGERLKFLFTLKELDIRCVPINILNPRKGTPLENMQSLDPLDIIKFIAVARLLLQKATIKIAGGREYGLRDMQALAFMAGANGMIIGGYLTTSGRSVEQDLKMAKDLGFEY